MRPPGSVRSAITTCGLLFASAIGMATGSYGEELAHTPDPVPQIDPVKESKVKAVYLYSFGRFTKWPTRPSTTFRIGLVGESPIGASLERISKKRTIQDTGIEIKRFPSADSPGLELCEILFVPRSVSEDDAAALMSRLRGLPVLTVTEGARRPEGTVVNFSIEGDGIIFEINMDAAQRKRLAMDARLLRQGKKMPSGKQ